jgi:hypothetical protein
LAAKMPEHIIGGQSLTSGRVEVGAGGGAGVVAVVSTVDGSGVVVVSEWVIVVVVSGKAVVVSEWVIVVVPIVVVMVVGSSPTHTEFS